MVEVLIGVALSLVAVGVYYAFIRGKKSDQEQIDKRLSNRKWAEAEFVEAMEQAPPDYSYTPEEREDAIRGLMEYRKFLLKVEKRYKHDPMRAADIIEEHTANGQWKTYA